MRGLTLSELFERYLLRGITSLPLNALFKLIGKKVTTIDGERLSPQLQVLLDLQKAAKSPGLTDIPIPRARKIMRRTARIHRSCGIDVKVTKDLKIPISDNVELDARLYLKIEKPRPLMVYFHGGGFALGDLETHDEACRFICKYAGVQVLSVAYRLAPEFPFPTAMHDCRDAFVWAAKNAKNLFAQPNQISVGGDSAGANLAAVVALMAAKENNPEPMPEPYFQFLLYPTTDRSKKYPSADLFAEGFILTQKDIEKFQEIYKIGDDGLEHSLIYYLNEYKLDTVAPAIVVTAAFDPLRDEGEAYAEALKARGIKVLFKRMPGMVHGFIGFIGLSTDARKCFRDATDLIKKQLKDLK